MKNAHRKHLLFTGGGTLGPVLPLFAIIDEWKKQEPDILITWIGTPHGPERELIARRGEAFIALASPKLSRHQPWLWPFIPFLFCISVAKAWFYLTHLKPQLIFSAGAFVSVPVAFAGFLLRIPLWIHQLDVEAGLANKMMAKIAKRISVTWLSSLDDYPKRKTLLVGGLITDAKPDHSPTFLEELGLNPEKPTLFVFGGGTGAKELNDAMEIIGGELKRKMNIIHLTGIGKMTAKLEQMGEGYAAREFFAEDMAHAWQAVDLVVSRAGMGTILSLVKYKKPTILVPIQDSHQVANARIMEERGAVKALYKMTPQVLKQEIEHLMADDLARKELGKAAGKAISLQAQQKIVETAKEMLEK